MQTLFVDYCRLCSRQRDTLQNLFFPWECSFDSGGTNKSQSVEQRLARVLLAICQREPESTTPDGLAGVSLTHQDLAHLVNSRRQAVSAILGQFADAGYIAKKGRRLQLTNIKALVALSVSSLELSSS